MGSESVNLPIVNSGPAHSQRRSIALLTDSSAQLPSALAEQHNVAVVPVSITLDGREYLEGVDLDPDQFYSLHREDSVLSTSQPAPGSIVQLVEEAACAGADEVLAVLVGSAYSGTVQSAKIAAAQTSIPLHVLDTGTASFGVAACVLAAAELVAAGGTIEQAASGAHKRSGQLESVFVLQGLELARRSGRFHQIDLDGPPKAGTTDDGIMVLWTGQGELEVIATVFSVAEAVDAMAERVLKNSGPMRVASSLAGPPMAQMSELLLSRLAGDPKVASILEYRVGPSVAAQTGPGTAGVFYWPA